MIDSKIFKIEELLQLLLSDPARSGWIETAEILPDYHFPFASPDATALCAVRCGGQYLCFSKGPEKHYYWNGIGHDFKTPEIALIALLQAPTPPHFKLVKSPDMEQAQL
ncbi:MAG: hypothetical protein WC708_00165 [Lentisphaeria bacterium]